jgi:mannose-6-phosphate isomerase-like protein (cupin superfamily)
MTMSVQLGSQRPYPEFRQNYATTQQSPVVWQWSTLAEELDKAEHTEYGTLTLSAPNGGFEVAPGTSMTLQVVQPGDRTTPHEHAWWHLYFVRSGTGTMVFGAPDDVVRLNAGDIVFIPAWVPHHLENGATQDLLLLNMSNLPQQSELNNLLSEEGGKQC